MTPHPSSLSDVSPPFHPRANHRKQNTPSSPHRTIASCHWLQCAQASNDPGPSFPIMRPSHLTALESLPNPVWQYGVFIHVHRMPHWDSLVPRQLWAQGHQLLCPLLSGLSTGSFTHLNFRAIPGCTVTLHPKGPI